MRKPQQAPRKKQRPSESPSSGDGMLEIQLPQIFSLLSEGADLNPLADLIELLSANSSNVATHELQIYTKGVHFLVKSLQSLLKDRRIPLSATSDDLGEESLSRPQRDEAEEAVATWLQARWKDAVKYLCQLLFSTQQQIRLLGLKLLMALQRDASSSVSKGSAKVQWSNTPWQSLTFALLVGSPSPESDEDTLQVDQDVVDAFTTDFLQEYDDVRFAFCKQISVYLQNPPKHLSHNDSLRPNAIRYLWGLTAIPTKLEDLNTFLVPGLDTKRTSQAEQKGGSDLDDEVEDWFSDSDDDGKVRKATSSSLGTAAQSAVRTAEKKRRLKRNPPFADAVVSLSAQKATFSRAWLSVLLPKRNKSGKCVGGMLSVGMTHEVLVRMHAQILPHLVKPNLLHDFLVDAVDAGGATSLLALNAFYTLMTVHNLNYPSFYIRLYALLLSDPPFLHVRYRSRFLRLLDVFLTSTHLSAALVASFAKRLSRAALRSSPAAIVVVIPFVWNLCKRHKRCLGLIHREFEGDRFNAGPAGLDDPYDPHEPNPLKTGAINSSLWELAAMGSLLATVDQTSNAEGSAHYSASVSSTSRILAEPFTKERYDLEDFLDLTYTTMFESDTAKSLRRREGRKVQIPAIAFDLPRTSAGKRIATFKKRKMRQEDDISGEKEDHDAAQGNDDETQDTCNQLFSFY